MDYEIRDITIYEVEELFNIMCHLDHETDFMLYEPDERRMNENGIENLKNKVKSILEANDFFKIVYSKEDGIVGFMSAERGKQNRVKHSAYIVIGIRKKYQNQGIGKSLFKELNQWAINNKIMRLELIVRCDHHQAIHLYECHGFYVEGKLRKSVFVNGKFMDEYCMAKIFND